jgi:cytoskeleton protein RodZ
MEASKDEPAADVLTAGEVLHEERLRRGLSEKEVADELHITMHYVKAIESDCYEKLPASIFATGYIKSYALLLNLDPNRLMELYADFNMQQQEIEQEQLRRQAKRKKDRNMPWVIMSVLGFIAGFAGLWVYNYYFSSSEQDAVGISTDNSAVNATLVQNAPTRDSQAEPANIEIANTEVESIALVAGNGAALIAVQQAVQGDVIERATDNEPQTLALNLDATVPPIISPDELTSTDSDQALSIDANGSDVLRLEFSGESWVEINDGDSKQIYRDIRVAGDVVEIAGVAPFNLLIGDAPFVELTLNGKEIDVTNDIRIDNSARLTVGL